VPELREVDGHVVACHWAERIKAGELKPHVVEPIFEPGRERVPAGPPPD
jgi:hypothetical protein